MSLSICLITRDAEERLERALGSVAGLGAELIVGDTGSKDSTVTIARAFGAKVRMIDWQDDFGAAQNQALVEATGDWVMWLNPAEELLPIGQEQIPELLSRPEALAYILRVQEITRADQPDQATEVLLARLFRRHPEVRFIGRLHPHLAVPLDQLARQYCQRIYRSDLVLQHHAYLSVLTPSKLRWATRLLERELADRPGQLHYLIEYGRNLLRLNDPKGHEVLAEASDIVLAASGAAVPPTATVASLLEYLLTVSPQQSRSRLSAEQAHQLALRWFPNSAPLLWHLAQRAFQAQRFRDASLLLEKLIELGRTATYERTAAFDASIMGEPAILNLARCHVRLGNLAQAEACFTQLLASATYAAQAREGLTLVQDLRFGMSNR